MCEHGLKPLADGELGRGKNQGVDERARRDAAQLKVGGCTR
jgi:hypothetical protein